MKDRRLLLMGCAAGLSGFAADKCLSGAKLGVAQMALCTLLVFGSLGIVVGNSLARPRQAGVALGLMALHFLLLLKLAVWFPLPNMIIGISGAALETLVVILLYARIGQFVDPKGPYGLTSQEIDRKRLLQKRLNGDGERRWNKSYVSGFIFEVATC